MEVPDSKLPAMHNLILLLAYALGDSDPVKANLLRQKISSVRPIVTMTFGRAGIDLTHLIHDGRV